MSQARGTPGTVRIRGTRAVPNHHPMIDRCSLCPNYRPRVLPTGPIPARILFLGEQPAEVEDKYGEPFVGKTGSELIHTYFPIAGLHRDYVYIDNARRCSEPDYENPTNEQAQSCCNLFLGRTLNQVRPQIVVPMGAVACSVFVEVKNLALQHGIPIPAHYSGWSGVLFPTFHPSSGLHQTAFMIALMKDFDRLGKLIRELDQL